MSDPVVRVVVAIGVVVVALLVARLGRRFQQPAHPRVDLAGTGLPGGVVIFTSSGCDTCADARAALKDAGVQYREVTWELESDLFTTAGVSSVPLIVVRRDDESTVGQIVGRPRGRVLRSLVTAASASSVADP